MSLSWGDSFCFYVLPRCLLPDNIYPSVTNTFCERPSESHLLRRKCYMWLFLHSLVLTCYKLATETPLMAVSLLSFSSSSFLFGDKDVCETEATVSSGAKDLWRCLCMHHSRSALFIKNGTHTHATPCEAELFTSTWYFQEEWACSGSGNNEKIFLLWGFMLLLGWPFCSEYQSYLQGDYVSLSGPCLPLSTCTILIAAYYPN